MSSSRLIFLKQYFNSTLKVRRNLVQFSVFIELQNIEKREKAQSI